MPNVHISPEAVHTNLVNPKTGAVGVGTGLRRWTKSPTVCQGAHLVPTLQPLDRLGAMAHEHGYTHLITGNPVRAAQDDCRHHLVGWMIDNKGFTRPLTCSGQTQGPFQGSRYTLGEWFVAEESSNPNAASGLGTAVGNVGFRLTRGYTYGLIPYQNPETYLVQWDSHWGGGAQT